MNHGNMSDNANVSADTNSDINTNTTAQQHKLKHEA
jgi:hypothetical protein